MMLSVTLSLPYFLVIFTFVLNLLLVLRTLLKTLARLPDTFDWENKEVLITGCTSGIGKAITEKITQPDFKLRKIILTGRNEPALVELKRDIETINNQIQIQILALDLESPHNSLKVLTDKDIEPDVFINNAGLSQREQFVDMSYSSCEYIMNVNCNTPIAMTTKIIQGMKTKGGGLIINTLSVSSMIPVSVRTMYCASKWAMMGFYQTLRSEVYGDGIHIVNVYPHYVKTNVSRNSMTGDGQKFGKMDANIENGYQPEEVAEIILDGIRHGENEIVVAPLYVQLAIKIFRVCPPLCEVFTRYQFKKQMNTIVNAQ